MNDDPPLQALPGHLVSVPRGWLGGARLVLDTDALARIEDALREVLALSYLCRDEPNRPPTPSGPIDYPRWGEIYYVVGQRYGGDRKRYVVVSHDHWNRADGTAIGVRTTTQTRRWGTAFPPIENGQAKACCGNATVFAARRFDSRERSQPRGLSLGDMVAIGRGLVEVLQLEAALGRAAGRAPWSGATGVSPGAYPFG